MLVHQRVFGWWKIDLSTFFDLRILPSTSPLSRSSNRGGQDPSVGARTVALCALLPPTAPSGAFFENQQISAWWEKIPTPLRERSQDWWYWLGAFLFLNYWYLGKKTRDGKKKKEKKEKKEKKKNKKKKKRRRRWRRWRRRSRIDGHQQQCSNYFSIQTVPHIWW